MERIPEPYGEKRARYLKHADDPLLLVHLLIKELVEDCTFVLDVDKLPDQYDCEQLREDCKKKQQEMEEEEKEGQKMNNAIGVFTSKYMYGDDLLWKYEMLQVLCSVYNEPTLNLHFLGPYLKSFTSS